MSLAGCVTMQSLMGTKFLEMLGNADIRERLLVPALRGEKIGGICMTEPNAGSDLGGIATTARKVDGGYLLKGQKMWVTSAPVADFFTVFARAGEARKLTIFLVEKDFKGLHHRQGHPEDGRVGAADVRTRARRLLRARTAIGSEPRGGRRRDASAQDCSPKFASSPARWPWAARAARSKKRCAMRASASNSANRSTAIRRSSSSSPKWRPISRLRAARALRRLAEGRRQAAPQGSRDGEAVRLGSGGAESATRRRAYWPPMATAWNIPVQRHLRDIRFTLIGGGTSEILKLIIAKELRVSRTARSRCCWRSPGSTAMTSAPRWSCRR